MTCMSCMHNLVSGFEFPMSISDYLLNSSVDMVSIGKCMCVKLRLMHMMFGSAFESY